MKRFVAGLMLLSSVAFADGAIICKSDSKGACKDRAYCCYTGSESDGGQEVQGTPAACGAAPLPAPLRRTSPAADSRDKK